MSPKELRSRRIALGLSVREVAHELGVTETELQQMEKGSIPLPAHAKLSAVLDALERRAADTYARDCLIIEDDTAVRQLFAKRLRAEGVIVDEAADGYEALDATTKRDYRLMLLDLRLPKLSGAELLARYARKPGAKANVIVISAAGSGDVREVAGSKLVHAILRKKFAIDNADLIFPALAQIATAQ